MQAGQDRRLALSDEVAFSVDKANRAIDDVREAMDVTDN